MSNELTPTQALVSRGYSEEEANALVSYKERGLPGVTKLRADAFEKLFIMGYSCKDIHTQFPEYELGMIVYAREKFKWDEKRNNYQGNLAQQVGQAASLAQAEAMRFLFDVLAATHEKNRNEIMRYLANPEREKAPDFLPKTLSGYQTLVNMVKDLTQTGKGSKDDNTTPASALVHINVNQVSGEKPAIEIKQDAVKQALLRKAGKKDS